jgi:hypothetical protein
MHHTEEEVAGWRWRDAYGGGNDRQRTHMIHLIARDELVLECATHGNAPLKKNSTQDSNLPPWERGKVIWAT